MNCMRVDTIEGMILHHELPFPTPAHDQGGDLYRSLLGGMPLPTTRGDMNLSFWHFSLCGLGEVLCQKSAYVFVDILDSGAFYMNTRFASLPDLLHELHACQHT